MKPKTTAAIAFIALVGATLAMPATAAIRTWSGASAVSANWSDPANWGGSAPVDGDEVVFPAAASRQANVNDLPTNTLIPLITFTGGGYAISGNAVQVQQFIQNLTSPITNVVSLPINGSLNLTIMMGGTVGSNLVLAGAITGSPLALNILGSGSVHNTLKLGGTNAYPGGTTLTSMLVIVDNDSAFGTGAVTATDSFPSTIDVNGHTVANAGLFSGSGIAGKGVVTGWGAWSGPILFNGPAGIGVHDDLVMPLSLIFSGDFTGNMSVTAPVNVANGHVLFMNDSTQTASVTAGAGVLYIQGSSSDITIMPGAYLYADGLVRNVAFSGDGGTLAPGIVGTGVLHTHNVSLPAGNTMRMQLGGPSANNSLLDVVGTVTLGGNLDLFLGYVPLPGTTFTLIQSSGGVTGQFAGLPEGAIFVSNQQPLKISYAANSGRNVTLAVATPYVTSVRSRKVHGAAGAFDVALQVVPFPTNPTESRAGPSQTLVFVFDKPVTAGTAQVAAGTATAGTPIFNGNEMTVPLTGVADAQYVYVQVSNVVGADGAGGGTAQVRVGYLRGDVNQDRVVTLADLGVVNAQLSQPVSAANFLKDVNASGTVTLGDKAVTNANLTSALPP